MKNWQVIIIFGAMAMISLGLTACGSDTNDVPSLSVTPTPDAADQALDDEVLMMEFAECLRDEGMQVTDPTARPNSTRSFIRLRQRRNVVLPQPDGPISAVTR